MKRATKLTRVRLFVAAVVGVGAWGAPALAADPQLGGAMKHIFVTLYEPTKTLYHFIQDGEDERVMLYDYGDSYTGGAAVLNGMHYAARYGWLPDGSWSIPSQRGIFVTPVEQSPGLEVYGQDSFAPILGTAGSDPVWSWSTAMVHNWYAVSACGWYEATYKVYVGFTDGTEDTAYTPTFVHLIWQFADGAGDQLGDWDGDGDADLCDFAMLQQCYGADVASGAPGECGCFDADVDEDVDATDYAAFATEFTGP
ncbi:MAG: hypothetical protein H6817_11705 [Phycisphaerales bacterium]|nr:hypothetical protein [Phycisphaerales bacterium]